MTPPIVGLSLADSAILDDQNWVTTWHLMLVPNLNYSPSGP